MQVIYKPIALKNEQEKVFMTNFFGFRYEITLLSFILHLKSSL